MTTNSNEGPPLVSVLVCAYQHAGEIAQCLDSILTQQTDFAFEIILGEDGSTDGTQEICREYASRYPSIIKLGIRDQSKKVILYGRKMGKYNLLKTIQEGTGKYFAFLDGDDYWSDPAKLQKQVDFLEANEQYSFCTTDRMVLKDGALSRDTVLQAAFEESGGKAIEITTAEVLRNYVKTNVILLRRDCLDMDVIEKHYTEINDTFLFFMSASKRKGILLPWVTGVYRLHEGGRWSTMSRLQQSRMSYHTYRGLCKTHMRENADLIERYQATCRSYFINALINGKPKDALIAFREQPLVCLRGTTRWVSSYVGRRIGLLPAN